ncbi:MAG TPA: hypothetical protein VFD68_02650 [Gemmatimonadales bacterium]|nr:hypothetical protein [Gemmatimonadales bacterium]
MIGAVVRSRAGIRPASPDDIPEIAELRMRVFSWRPQDSAEAREAAVSRVFFDNPLLDPALPPLVCMNERGRLVGFIGVSGRTFQWRGSTIRVAVPTGFMVDPASRGVPGVMLLRRLLSGPQAFTLADSPNLPGRRLMEKLGGTVAPLDSLYWVRPLRPVRYAIGQIRNGPLLFATRLLARPLAVGLDAVATRVAKSPYAVKRPDTREEPLSPAELMRCVAELASICTPSPCYHEPTLRWLMDALGQGPRGQEFERVLVRSAAGEVLGWYLRFTSRRGVSEVVQLGATKERYGALLDHVFHAAWRDGSVAVTGRVQPMFLETLAEKGCVFSRAGPPVMIHSRHADLLQDILGGRAFMSRLDGEWWMIHLSLKDT